MSEMVERVARAMAAKNRPPRTVGEDDWGAFVPLARVAVAAMREPTEAMWVAAREWSRTEYGKPIGHEAATGCFHAMLDAALD